MISNNILDVATVVDIAQFEHVTVRCNRKSMTSFSLPPTEENCPRTINMPLAPKFAVFPEVNEDDATIKDDPAPVALGNKFIYGYLDLLTKY